MVCATLKRKEEINASVRNDQNSLKRRLDIYLHNILEKENPEARDTES